MEGDARADARAAADAIIAFVAPAYGPGGSHKIVDADRPYLVPSGAAALCEAPVQHPAADPFVDLAAQVRDHVGDQATGAVLLAGHLVRGAVDSGLPIPAILDGYRLARRQALSVLAAKARPVAATELAPIAQLVDVQAGELADHLVALVEGRRLTLDDVGIQVEGGEAQWLDGARATPQRDGRSHRTDVPVLIVDPWTVTPRQGATAIAITGQAALGSEEAMRQRARGDVGVFTPGLLACRGALDEGLADRLAQDGWAVWTDAPADALRRMEAATGASTQRIGALDADHAGRADLIPCGPRRKGLIVKGPGPSATWVLPGLTPVLAKAVEIDGERCLRAIGAWLDDPRGLPGGGAWQHAIAASLRSMADHAPGKTPLAVTLAAQAFDALLTDLRRNAGLDPIGDPIPAGYDIHACVKQAVTAAFEAAESILRVDARHTRRASSAVGLKGSNARPGSPKGLPGDIPPLM